MMYHVDMEGR